MEYTEVQRQHEQHEDVESDPEPERAHGSSVVLRGKKKKSSASRAAQEKTIRSGRADSRTLSRGLGIYGRVVALRGGSTALRYESSRRVASPERTVTGVSQRRCVSPAIASVSSVLSQYAPGRMSGSTPRPSRSVS